MASWSGLGLSGGTVAAATVSVTAVMAGAMMMMMGEDDPAPAPSVPAPDPAPVVATIQQPEPTAPPADPAPAPVPTLTLDVIRVDAEGEAVVAGVAAKDALVVARIDATEAARTMADGGGAFVLLFSAGIAEVPRLLTLEQIVNGVTYVADERVVIDPIIAPAPEPEPLVVASAPPEAERNVTETPTTAEIVAASPQEAPKDAQDTTTPPAAPDPFAPIISAEVIPPEAPQVSQAPKAVAPATAPRLVRLKSSGAVVVDAAPDTFEISTISYDAQGDVVLAGSARADNVVRIYVDNQPVETARVDETGAWKAALDEVESGVYTLRVDEITPQGDVAARVETPFERTAPQIVQSIVAQAETSLKVITVQPGFSLWQIAEENFGDGQLYVQVFKANSDLIRNPDLIYPGQVFELPGVILE